MEYQDLIAYYGGLSKAARGLHLRVQSVWRWRDRGIPLPRQYQIEAYTGGALLAPPVPQQGRLRQAQRIAAKARRAALEQEAASAQQTTTVARRLSRR